MTGGRASSGPIGGASGDAGVEYRRAIAAYAVAHGLAGDPLAGFGVPLTLALVASVALETDDALDDIRIEFASGRRALVQAKRTLTADRPLKDTAKQWAAAVRSPGFDPVRDRLVLVGAHMSASMRDLSRALERCRTDQPGAFTGAERRSLDRLTGLVPDLTSDQLRSLQSAAVILAVDVEEEHSQGAAVARALLGRVVGPGSESVRAWRDLVANCGRVARLRGGFSLEGWVRLLEEDGHSFNTPSPAKSTLNRLQALDAYRLSLRRRGSFVDLRPLGLDAPPIELSDLDASVDCLPLGGERRDHEHLAWSLLRRNRIILTGLPGGGKSVALAKAASVLSDAAGAPLPALVSLRDVNDLPHTRGFGDRILDVAVRDLLEPRRSIVRSVLEQGMYSGATALILDSLDETHQHRGAVVAELAELSASISCDVVILLATRHVAYAQASTLGWDALEIEAPQHPERAVRSVLGAVARSRNVPDPETWIATRSQWVGAALSADRAIRETPLMPVLLALLAAERDDGSLPTTRAQILYAVVEAAADRREVRRGRGFRVAGLDETTSADALLACFAAEARTLADAGGRSSRVNVEAAIATELIVNWDASRGAATSASKGAVHFWDEIGCLVINGEDDSIAPRLELFLDIGDAIGTSSMSSAVVAEWARDRINDRRLEAVILAAALNDDVAEHLSNSGIGEGDHELLMAATEAIRQGASIQGPTRESLILALFAQARLADVEGWKALQAILDLASATENFDLGGLLASYPVTHKRIAEAAWCLRSASEGGAAHDTVLMDALRVTKLDKLPSRSGQSTSRAIALRFDSLHEEVIESSARRLLGRIPEATELVIDLMRHATIRRYNSLRAALSGAGLTDAVSAVDRELARKLPDVSPLFENINAERYSRLVDHLSSRPFRELNTKEAARLDEFADLFATLDLNEMWSWPRRDEYPIWQEFVDAVIEVGRFDARLMAAEAAILRERIEQFDHESFFSLEIAASKRPLDGWSRVNIPMNLAQDLLQGLFMGEGIAIVAASALAAGPPELVQPLLSNAVAQLASHRAHQYIAAWSLAKVSALSLLDDWAVDPRPALRQVAAGHLPVLVESAINRLLVDLCRDPDLAVAAEAVKRAATGGDTAIPILQAVAASERGRWLCDRCGNENTSAFDYCAQCRVMPPSPQKSARELLLRMRTGAEVLSTSDMA